MDVIILCHTEFGYVYNKEVIFDKGATDGVKQGVKNLIDVADRYGAKVTFAVCPEVVNYFPQNIKHEIGLHIHPGWVECQYKGFKWYVGVLYTGTGGTCRYIPCRGESGGGGKGNFGDRKPRTAGS